jgi:drug/metabolite transporter (DMT)-like permease
MLLGSLAAGTAAVCYGASQFMARQLVTDQAPPLVTATFALFMGMLVLAAFSHRGIRQDRRALKKGFLLMVLAGLSASAGVGFNYSALGLAPVVIVAPVSAGAPLISLFLAHIFLQRLEKVTLRIWLGAMLVVAGVIMVTLGSV